MITISELHYQKILQAVELLHKNIGFLYPNDQNIREVHLVWTKINSQLNTLYKKLNYDLQSIIAKNQHLANENRQLNEKINTTKEQMVQLIKNNTIQRGELAKNVGQYNKLKEVAKSLKVGQKQLQQKLKIKDRTIEELIEKSKRYKKQYQEQVKKVQKVQKMLNVLQVTQKSSAKQKQLDDEMMQLQAQLEDIDGAQQFDDKQ